MRGTLSCAAMLVFVWGLLAQRSTAAELKTFYSGSPIFICDSSVGILPIPNSTGSTIYVKKAAIWHGVDMGQQAHVNSEMYRDSDNTLVMTFPEQRFAQPNGTTQLVSDFMPDYFRLLPGDILRVAYSCIPVAGSGFHAQISATVWYTTTP